MGTKHAARSPAKKREDELQELLLMTRRALFKGIHKELDHYRVVQFQDGKSGGLHLTEEPGAAPDAEIEFALIDQRAEELRPFDLTVERLRAGAYGICEDCGKEISAARLKAPPPLPGALGARSGVRDGLTKDGGIEFLTRGHRMLLCSRALGRAVRLLAVPVVRVPPWRAARGGEPGVSLQEEMR
jgi:RNA polymerase-binding transcription factor DksA